VRVTGVLAHDLPGPLVDAVIIVNRGQKNLTQGLGRGGELLADVSAIKLAQPWNPGEPLDLGLVTDRDRDTTYFRSLIASEVGQPEGLQAPDNDRTRITARLTAVALLSQLQPPDTRGDVAKPERLAQRRLTHGFDLGEWFTEPSVIIIGHVGERDSGPATPVPLFVSTGGGYRPVDSAGRTVVRWVYPLHGDPPGWPTVETPGAPGGEAGETAGEGSRDGTSDAGAGSVGGKPGGSPAKP
jgi:hypothetical protein